MADRYVETTSEGWFSRIGNSIGGALIGLLMFAISFPLLFWNEGRAVRRAQDLEHGASSVVSLGSTDPDEANEGELVHVTGPVEADDEPTDEVFAVSADAIKLARTVEMYQWKEKTKTKKKKKVGGGTEKTTEYTYHKTWSEKAINSSNFKISAGHSNPGSMPYQSETFTASGVHLGGFDLAPTFVDDLSASTDYRVDDADLPAGARMHAGGIYIGSNPSSPRIGDVRITYTIAEAGPASVIGAQEGSRIAPYSDEEMNGEIALLERGTVGSQKMFESAQESNYILTWVLRLVGFLLMFIGLRLVARPLSVVADFIPFVGSIVEFGTGLIAFFIALALSGVTIAVAWIFYRPLLAILIIAGAIGAVVAAVMLIRKARASDARPA